MPPLSKLLRRAALPALALLATPPLGVSTLGAQPITKDAPAAAARAAERPTLVVFLTVDQLRPDYFDRFASQLTGGLGRLRRGGAFFTDAHQDHAITETAPGHASTMSGRFPEHTGIFRNAAGVQDAQAPAISGTVPGASPFRFRGTVLFDWLRIADPRSRALSVSRKDRGAILPLGRAKQPVFWYDGDWGFTTSTYYADTLPDWVKRVNARDYARRYGGRAWEPLLPASAYPEPDSVAVEHEGKSNTFPHVVSADRARGASELLDTPFMDEMTLDAALAGLEALRLGTGPQTDVLAVSLSTTDAVGHAYGPDSREMHDHILRLDRMLGVFLDSLYRVRDSSRVIVALTADHGMTPYPELHFKGTDPMRGRADVAPVVRAYKQRLAARGVDTVDAFDVESGAIVMDPQAFARAGVNRDSVRRALVADLRRVPGVMRVDLREELPRQFAAGDAYARRWLHMIPRDLPVAATITLKPFHYYSTTKYATHGSPHLSDTHVPVLFYGAPFRPGTYGGFARVVDMAPTLAAVLGVAPAEPLDGVVLKAAIR